MMISVSLLKRSSAPALFEVVITHPGELSITLYWYTYMVGMFIEVLYSLGLTLGVGSSTFALIFFLASCHASGPDASEKRFIHIVVRVLRVGMVFIGLGLTLAFFFGAAPSFAQWFLLGVIVVNAVLMEYHCMPMRYGPVLAGGSWYMLFFVSATPLGGASILLQGMVYVWGIVIFYAIFHFIRKRMIARSNHHYDVATDSATLLKYGTDASAFKILPKAVYYPKDADEIARLTRMCALARKTDPRASITVRAGGTCMSGGPLNNGWILDLTKHMHAISIDPERMTATVEMGAYFRDIESEAAKHGLMFAPYPSSHLICGIGGMLGNNASGEKSLRLGATSDNVIDLEVVLADGTITRAGRTPIASLTEPREIALHTLFSQWGELLRERTGSVPKSASGYRLEKVVDGDSFNAVPLFVGAQGTLGIITKATLKLVPIPKYTELILISAPSLKDISRIINTVERHNPEGLETFDSNTFDKARIHLAESAALIESYIAPASHLVILAQLSERTKKATKEQAVACMAALALEGFHAEHITNPEHVAAAWNVRRNSFTLMRDHNEEGFRAVPCIEDVIVPLSSLGTFITSLRTILKKRKITYGFHGHIGDGSLRIIPIFDFTNPRVGEEITGLMVDVFALVKRLHGNISADHSDGIVRTPFLTDFYGAELTNVFAEIKRMYDPLGIMNPGKKVGGTVDALYRALNMPTKK
jgi:FAD/FMN-containing dehydrogenase